MSETSSRTHMDELRIAMSRGISIGDFYLESSRSSTVVGYVKAQVTHRKDDGSPKTVQFSTHELHIPLGQDESFYPAPVKEVLDLIRRTATAIQ